MATKRSVSPSTRNFRKLFNLTKDICTIPKEVNYNSIVQKKSERWGILLDIWQKNVKKYGSVFFYNPLVHIFYGIHLPCRSAKVINLLNAIEDVMLNDDEAFNVWVKTKKFSTAYRCATKNFSGLDKYHDFQQAYSTLHMLKGKDIENIPKELSRRDMHILNSDYVLERQKVCDKFKKMFHKLIPASMGWTYEEWTSYSHICDCLYNIYGVDFKSSTSHLNAIHYLFGFRKKLPPFTNIDCIIAAPLNYIIFKRIFPRNTDAKLCNLYNEIIHRCVRDEQCERLQTSWLVQILKNWAGDPTHPYHDSVRKPVFNLIIGSWKCPSNQ